MKKIVPVLKVGDKVTEYNECSGVLCIGEVTGDEYYRDERCYCVQYPGMIAADRYNVSNLRSTRSRGHGRYVCYIRPYENGDEYKLSVTDTKMALRYLWNNVVFKITTMEQCEELKRIFEEIENGAECELSVSAIKKALRYSWDNVVAKITTMEQCEELKRIFDEINKEYYDAKKAKND